MCSYPKGLFPLPTNSNGLGTGVGGGEGANDGAADTVGADVGLFEGFGRIQSAEPPPVSSSVGTACFLLSPCTVHMSFFFELLVILYG